MFVYALIYNFNIKARHFSTDKWKMRFVRGLVDNQNYRSGIRPLVIMFVILSKESFKKKTVCYSIKQRSNSCCCKKKQTLQCNGLKSKHSNSFFIVFIVWCQFFLFCFVLWDKCWCFYHFSELSNLKKNVLFIFQQNIHY